MRILKREIVPFTENTATETEQETATVKKPVLPEGSIVGYTNELGVTTSNEKRSAVLSLPKVAKAVGDSIHKVELSIADRLYVARTNYDTENQQEYRARGRIRNRTSAISAMCICCKGSRKLVVECLAVTCPLWAFRLGKNPFRGKSVK
jgi:hypothetical protein